MKTDLFSVITVGVFIFASVLFIGALADRAIKEQNIICQEGC